MISLRARFILWNLRTDAGAQKSTIRKKMDQEFHQKSRYIFSTAPILVPGMGFTENGVRLGKGGGYYDRYLETHPGHKTIALAYEFQILHELSAETYDKSVDMIVTEKRVIRCSIK